MAATTARWRARGTASRGRPRKRISQSAMAWIAPRWSSCLRGRKRSSTNACAARRSAASATSAGCVTWLWVLETLLLLPKSLRPCGPEAITLRHSSENTSSGLSPGMPWQPDKLLPGFEALELPAPDDYDGAVVATLVRLPGGQAPRGAVLY